MLDAGYRIGHKRPHKEYDHLLRNFDKKLLVPLELALYNMIEDNIPLPNLGIYLIQRTRGHEVGSNFLEMLNSLLFNQASTLEPVTRTQGRS